MAASRPFYSYFSEIGPGLAMCETLHLFYIHGPAILLCFQCHLEVNRPNGCH